MSSQMNPIIAAFLAASAQAEEQVRSVKNYQILSERLALEKESQDAENQWKQGQLDNFVKKLQYDAEQDAVKNQLDSDRNKLMAFRELAGAADKDIFDNKELSDLAERLLPGLKARFLTAKEKASQKTEAKVEDIKATAPAMAEAAGLKAGRVAEIEQPFKVDLQNIRDVAAMQRQKAASDAAYARAMDVADKNVAARLQAAAIKANAPQKANQTKITAGERQKMIDLDVAEGLFSKLEEALKDEKKASYFVGQFGSGVRGLKRKFGTALPKEHAAMESLLSELTMTIGNPRFGASFTAGEERILKGAVPSMYGDIKPEEAKAKVAAALAHIKERKDIMADTYGFEKSAAPIKTGNSDAVNKLLQKYK